MFIDNNLNKTISSVRAAGGSFKALPEICQNGIDHFIMAACGVPGVASEERQRSAAVPSLSLRGAEVRQVMEMAIKKYNEKDERTLDLYLQEIGETELLTADEEAELARRIRRGDPGAFEKLVRANLRFVVSVAKQYQNQGLSLADLISEGNLGLIKAARRFDETRGFKFISYAVWWIRQAILHALAEQSRLIRLPLNKVEELRRLERATRPRGRREDQEETRPEFRPEDDPALRVTPDWASQPLSLDASIGDHDNFSLLDCLKDEVNPLPDETVMGDALKLEVERAIASLAPREGEILALYFGLNTDRSYTLEEIGTRFGLTRERVRQIKQKAINKLRYTARGHRLSTYTE